MDGSNKGKLHLFFFSRPQSAVIRVYVSRIGSKIEKKIEFPIGIFNLL